MTRQRKPWRSRDDKRALLTERKNQETVLGELASASGNRPEPREERHDVEAKSILVATTIEAAGLKLRELK